MTNVHDIDDIPVCCLSCKNQDCLGKNGILERKYADAVEADPETGEETCPFYYGQEDNHEYD